MTADHFKTWYRVHGSPAIRECITVGAILLIALACLPLLAVLLFFLRASLLFLLILAVVTSIVACIFSPKFRRWLRLSVQ